jgi:hypothetical protein
MSDLFIGIYSGGGGVNFIKPFGRWAHAIKPWEPLLYTKPRIEFFFSFTPKHPLNLTQRC